MQFPAVWSVAAELHSPLHASGRQHSMFLVALQAVIRCRTASGASPARTNGLEDGRLHKRTVSRPAAVTATRASYTVLSCISIGLCCTGSARGYIVWYTGLGFPGSLVIRQKTTVYYVYYGVCSDAKPCCCARGSFRTLCCGDMRPRCFLINTNSSTG
jgi:hypothetical protein